ncbi:unnamed protein product [Blepharisma stoltei]|uniref:Palmitoyltransferase n=1 Tax=Blepharisma stoltei TaxID=1481888 RepID=A0AAU9K596_9CILI|nr:unnamed protein product [Blepharisma stoltei]
MKKKNGFRTPFHALQVASWVIMIFHALIGILCISFLLSTYELVIFLIIYYTSFIIVIAQGIFLTKSDPSINIPFQNVDKSPTAVNFMCTICKCYVTETSKHCGSCDRCVDNFDHHCKWLNNCIGKSNYKQFIRLILLLEANLVILLIFEILIIDKWKNKGLDIDEDIENADIFFIILDIILNSIFLLLVGYLIIFHIFLKFKKLTTYDWIRQRKKAKKNAKKKAIQPQIIFYEEEENGTCNKNSTFKNPQNTHDELIPMMNSSDTKNSTPKNLQISQSLHKSAPTIDSDIIMTDRT